MGDVPRYGIDLLVLWDQWGVPGILGRTQSFPSVAPGAGLPKENTHLRYGWAGLVKSRSSVNGMTIRALGVVEKPSNQDEMKHNTGNRRSRSRGGKQRHGSGRNNFESNGPGGKVRGSAQQVLDKYLGLARDAQSSGDRIGAESFFQFAEHYFRVLNADGGNANQSRRDKQAQTSEELAGDGNMADAEVAAVTDQTVKEADAASAGDPANQPQPEVEHRLTDMIPPAIEFAPSTSVDEGSAPKPRRRRRAKAENSTEKAETASAS
mgnify:CR=1 FL=1